MKRLTGWLQVRRPRRRVLGIGLVIVATVVTLGLANPAQAAAVPYLNLYRDVNYGTLVWSGGGTGCFNLTGTQGMNSASSATAHNLAQPISGGYAYYRIDLYDHGDCTGYFMSINGHNGDDQYFSSLVYYPCYCNDRVSGVKILRIS